MPTIPDFRINPYVAPPTPGLSPEFEQAINQRIAEFDANQEFSDVLAYQNDSLMQQIAPFENDVTYANQVMNDTRNSIDTWAKQGDYENMTRDIKRGARRFSQQIAPLLQNKALYSQYLTGMDELYKTGKINIDTYSKAKAASLNNYKGFDPNNPQSSLFSGFTPSPDINVSDKVNKFLDGWKASGGSQLIPQPDGSFVERKWESANEDEILAAAKEYLLGDDEFTGYAQTQATIGNGQRVNDEVRNAITAGARKHGFTKTDLSLSWMPEYAFKNKQALALAQSIPSVPSSGTINPGANSIFKAQGLTQDKATGKVVPSSLYTRRDGKYYKTVDSQGNIVDPSTITTKDIPSTGAIAAGAVPQYKQVEVPESEMTTYTDLPNQQLVDMAANRYLAEKLAKGDISLQGYLGDEKLTKRFLELNLSQYNNPKYLNETFEQYEEAIKNSKELYGNKRFDISTIPGAASPEFTTLKDDDILANLTGQEVGILSTTIGGFGKGQRADINSLLDKLQEDDGYTVKTIRRLGPLQFNPFSNKPGMSYAINLEDKDGKPKTIEIAATMEDRELQPVQDVYNLAYKGMSGVVPFQANTIEGTVPGLLRVRTATNIDKADGKRKFKSFVEILDAQGNKINLPGIPQNIPLEHFGDAYRDAFAPHLLTKYLNPKYTK